MNRALAAIAACSLTASAIPALSVANAAPLLPSAKSADALVSTSPWWEKLTVTIAGDGKAKSCRYESSQRPASPQDCDVVGDQAGMADASGAKDQLTRITFERRFSPGGMPDAGKMSPGDTLIGKQIMALAIDKAGAVQGCKIIAADGDMTPDYGCKEASAERFKTSAPSRPVESPRAAFMTIIVYGHAEHYV